MNRYTQRIMSIGKAVPARLAFAVVWLLAAPVLFALDGPPGDSAPQTPQEEEKSSILQSGVDQVKEKFARISFGTELTGFVDFTTSMMRNGEERFTMGDLEFDFARELGRNAQLAGALVFNPETGTNLTVGFVDYHFWGGLIAPRGRLFSEKGFHIQAGRFDVPFGSDWQYLASKDRLTATAPLTTERLMDGGYNDYGLRVLGNSIGFNYTAYALRGVGNGFAHGGRIGFTPFNNPYILSTRQGQELEIGASYVVDTDGTGRRDHWACALDLETRLGPVLLHGEYAHRRNQGPDEPTLPSLNKGFHLTGYFDLGSRMGRPALLTARYEGFSSTSALTGDWGDGDLPPPVRLNRVTGGVHFTLSELFLLKVEYLHFVHTHGATLETEGLGRRSAYIQLVTTF
jgi:hypothetical protein